MNESAEGQQVDAIRELRNQITMTSFGLPTGIYRPDMLPWGDYNPNATITVVIPEKGPELLDTNGTNDETTLSLEEIEAVVENIDEEEEVLFDPITFEPIEQIDRTPRQRVHPLIAAPLHLPGDVIKHKTVHRIAGFLTEDIMSAFVPLVYDEGFPTFENGDPFWTCLHYEPMEAYAAFVKYLAMSSGGKMQVVLDDDLEDTSDPENIRGASGVRSISQLANELERDDTQVIAVQEQLQVWAQLYYWDWRAKAYDLFRVVQHRTQQEIRAIETQDSHYLISRRLIAKALEFMDDDEDFKDQLTPKMALDMLRLGMTGERLAAGMSATGGSGDGTPAVHTSVSMSLRQVANDSKGEEVEISESGGVEILEQALHDPKKTEILQDLILEMQVNTGS